MVLWFRVLAAGAEPTDHNLKDLPRGPIRKLNSHHKKPTSMILLIPTMIRSEFEQANGALASAASAHVIQGAGVIFRAGTSQLFRNTGVGGDQTKSLCTLKGVEEKPFVFLKSCIVVVYCRRLQLLRPWGSLRKLQASLYSFSKAGGAASCGIRDVPVSRGRSLSLGQVPQKPGSPLRLYGSGDSYSMGFTRLVKFLVVERRCDGFV